MICNIKKILKSKRFFLANLGHQANFTILFDVPEINFPVKNLKLLSDSTIVSCYSSTKLVKNSSSYNSSNFLSDRLDIYIIDIKEINSYLHT